MNNSIHDQYGPWALIAGGSEGIGLCFARQLAEAGLNLVLVARTREALESTAAELTEAHGIEVHCISADLSDRAAPQAIFDELRAKGIAIRP